MHHSVQFLPLSGPWEGLCSLDLVCPLAKLFRRVHGIAMLITTAAKDCNLTSVSCGTMDNSGLTRSK